MSNATMADKKPSKTDRHKVPRVNIQVPKPFADLARELAAKIPQPTTWFLLKLIADAADEAGVERPALPWEEDD